MKIIFFCCAFMLYFPILLYNRFFVFPPHKYKYFFFFRCCCFAEGEQKSQPNPNLKNVMRTANWISPRVGGKKKCHSERKELLYFSYTPQVCLPILPAFIALFYFFFCWGWNLFFCHLGCLWKSFHIHWRLQIPAIYIKYSKWLSIDWWRHSFYHLLLAVRKSLRL